MGSDATSEFVCIGGHRWERAEEVRQNPDVILARLGRELSASEDAMDDFRLGISELLGWRDDDVRLDSLESILTALRLRGELRVGALEDSR